jgi:hypothetical protein
MSCRNPDLILVCPRPDVWARVYRRLSDEFKSRGDILEEPPVALILGGWWTTSDLDKQKRWEATVIWAKDHNCGDLIPVLRDDEKYAVGVVSDYVSEYNFGDPIFDSVEYDQDISQLQECIDSGSDVNQLND